MMLSSILDIEFSPYKYLVHLDRIKALAEGLKTSPVVLELDISSLCDHHCAWCVDPPGTHSGKLMESGTVRKILGEASELGIKGIVFKGGGESTLHPESGSIFRMAALAGFEVGLVTNGSHLDQKGLAESIAEYCSYVRISIDGPTRELRKEIHKVDDFEKLKDNIKQVVLLRKQNRHPVIGGTFCLDYSKRAYIEHCITLGESLGLDYVLIRPPFCEEVGFPSPHTSSEAHELRSRINEAARNYTGKMKVMAGNWIGDLEMSEFNTCLNVQNDLHRRDTAIQKPGFNGIEHETRRCLASGLTLAITSEGVVYGCCCLRGIPDFAFGRMDYPAGITLQAILNSPQKDLNHERMRSVECLPYCTHPLKKINEIIEFLSLPQKFHASFL